MQILPPIGLESWTPALPVNSVNYLATMSGNFKLIERGGPLLRLLISWSEWRVVTKSVSASGRPG